jgi:hypothetical protein
MAELSQKRQRVTYGEAIEKCKELKSPLDTAMWVIEQFQAEMVLDGQEGKENVMPHVIERVKTRVKNKFSKYQKLKGRNSLSSDELMKPVLTPSIECVLDPLLQPQPSTSTEAEQPTKPGKPGRPPVDHLDDMTMNSQLGKIKDIVENLRIKSEIMGKTITQICGRIIQKENWVQDRFLGQTGKNIYDGTLKAEKNKSVMGCEEAAFLKVHELGISQKQWVDLRLRLGKSYGIWLPSRNMMATYEKSKNFTTINYLGGVRAPLVEILLKTLLDICMIPSVRAILNSLRDDAFPLKVRLLTGADGSGNHQVTHQVSKNSVSKGNRETVVSCVRDIKTQAGEDVYENVNVQSPNGIQIWMLIPQKENRELMEKFMEIVDRETEEVEKEGIKVVTNDGSELQFEIKVDPYLVDGKFAKEVTGTGGAYCLYGHCFEKHAHDIQKVQEGFPLNRTAANIHAVFDRLFDDESGEILKQRGDYGDRQGVTQKPLTGQDFHLAPRCLHFRLRVFSWFLKFLYRLLAKVLIWKKKHLTEKQHENVKKWKKKVIDTAKEITGILMDTPTSKGGTTDTGNTAWRFFSPDFIPVLESLLPVKYLDKVLNLHHKYSVMLRVISSKQRVDEAMLQQLCLETNVYLLTEFHWVHISESLHGLLCHSFQLINLNDGFGLGQLMEQGSEGNY